MPRKANALIHESSPYLLQHAYNPVQWHAWSDLVIKSAESNHKPLLISIGYSACHWCHVMEHESFEDDEVAEIMNTHFVCVKIDREEYPDIDRYYMDAVQLISGRGGWPLNCFALSDGRAFYGGTYYRKDQWIELLQKIRILYSDSQATVIEYASKLQEGIVHLNQLPLVNSQIHWNDDVLQAATARFSHRFDREYGGFGSSPKFPMPVCLNFLLARGHRNQEIELTNFGIETLIKMAMGGIYDHLCGGFARYSTDERWKVPHFEKMLYDNGLLLSIYSLGYLIQRKELLLETAIEIGQWLSREMKSSMGLFSSSVDADSEGIEGKFYVWKQSEIESIACQQKEVILDYYSVNDNGFWEEEQFILQRSEDASQVAMRHGISNDELKTIVSDFKEKAYQIRLSRIPPDVDDKCITSWNAIVSQGYIDLYIASHNQVWLDNARTTIDLLLKHQWKSNTTLFRIHKDGRSTIPGYHEDYAHLISALIAFYEATFEEAYLEKALALSELVLIKFDQDEYGFFHMSDRENLRIPNQSVEITDSVIPSSNSVFAECLFKLSLIYDKPHFGDLAKKMIGQISPLFVRDPGSYTNWMRLNQKLSLPHVEIVISGPECHRYLRHLRSIYLTNVIWAGSVGPSQLPILTARFKPDETLIYICENQRCQLPMNNPEDALLMLQQLGV